MPFGLKCPHYAAYVAVRMIARCPVTSDGEAVAYPLAAQGFTPSDRPMILLRLGQGGDYIVYCLNV